MNFYKYQGTGNDFVIIDDRQSVFNPEPRLVNAMCHRRFGIGADGLLLYRLHDTADFEMLYFNSNGHPGTMCGNGGRCIVKWAWESGLIGRNTRFEAPDGTHEAKVGEDELISLEMSHITSIKQSGKDWILDTGSPHYVIFRDQVDEIDVFQKGRAIRYSPEYQAKGINVNFVRMLDDHAIEVRTYERGVEAETYSCGTGVIASAIAAYFHQGLTNVQNRTTVQTKGGTLEVLFSANAKGKIGDVWLKGPAEKVFEGIYDQE